MNDMEWMEGLGDVFLVVVAVAIVVVLILIVRQLFGTKK
jgi:hypothetical protein